LILLALVWTSPQTAQAEDEAAKKARGRELIEQAKASYRKARFQEALTAYLEVFELFERPIIAYNIGQCHRQISGRESQRKAIFYYKLSLNLYKKKHPDQAVPWQAEADEYITELKARLAVSPAPDKPSPATPKPAKARIEILGLPAGARVMVDGLFKAKAPLAAPLEVAPGLRRLEVEAPGHHPWTGEARASAGAGVTVNVKMRRIEQRSTLWLALGITSAAIAVGGLGLGVAGTVQRNSLHEENNNRETDESAGWGNAGLAGFGIAGGFAAASIACWVLYGLSGSAPEEDTAAAPRFIAGAAPVSSGGMFSVGASF